MGKVNTVLGPIDAKDMGRTLCHEHFIWTYTPATLFDRQDKEALVQKCLPAALKAKSQGIQTVVDASPIDAGQSPEILAEVSKRSGINIICATGYIYSAVGATSWWNFKRMCGTADQECYDTIMKDITVGIRDTGIKAGMIKMGTDLNEITVHDEMVAKAAAKASKATGTVICCHTEQGTMGPEIADLLISEGADPKKIVLYHSCGSTDTKYLRLCAERGVYLAFDRFGLQGWLGGSLDIDRYPTLVGMMRAGYLDQLLISNDSIACWLGDDPAWPKEMGDALADYQIGHLMDTSVPILKKMGVTDAEIDHMMIENVQKLYG